MESYNMNSKKYMYAAIDWVIDLAAENGLKYRRNDFAFSGDKKDCGLDIKNIVYLIGGKDTPTGIMVFLLYDFERCGKKLKTKKDNFYNYVYARVRDIGVCFTFSIRDLDIHMAGTVNKDEDKIELVIRKVQKLLALADPSRNPSEEEAIAASMQAQKLLAKYNLDIADVTGKKNEEEIFETFADVGTGKKWKYELAEVIAGSYRCRCYFLGAECIVFYGYQSDALIARRVFMYLFTVGNRLASKYVKEKREECFVLRGGEYNSFCKGFTAGVNGELSRSCKALMLVVPEKVKESFSAFSSNFKEQNLFVDSTDYAAYETGVIEGRRALNAQYIEKAAGE